MAIPAGLKSKVEKLEETLKARRDVDKAVKILVTLKQIGEAEAYELIRQQATQKRLSMAQIATTIIGAQEVMAGLGLIGDAETLEVLQQSWASAQ